MLYPGKVDITRLKVDAFVISASPYETFTIQHEVNDDE